MATSRDASDDQELEVKIPAAAMVVVAEFSSRTDADEAVDALIGAGFGSDQLSLVARGAGAGPGGFQPGGLMITVHPAGRDREAMKILREHGPRKVTCGKLGATGELEEVEMPEETTGTP